MCIDLTIIIEAMVTLLAAIITAVVIPYIKSKTAVEQQTELNTWVRLAVAAAEQIYIGSGMGKEKKAYVIKWLTDRRIRVNTDKIDALIEAAVYALKDGVI